VKIISSELLLFEVSCPIWKPCDSWRQEIICEKFPVRLGDHVIHAGLVQGKMLKRGRKFVILGAFILAAVITPAPDILTQSLLALPAVALYEISLHFIELWEKAKGREK
jgi:hypothetical protein